MKRQTLYETPSEDDEQEALFTWAAVNAPRIPCLRLLYAIPNGGKRDKREAAKLKRTGTKKGVPDICLPVPKGPYHGIYIELKRKKGGQLSTEQRQWLRDLSDQGYYCAVCKGWEAAAKTISIYIGTEGRIQ